MDEVYLGNPNLKSANVQIEFTQEQIIEYAKCLDDPAYFIEAYIKIISIDDYQGSVNDPFNVPDNNNRIAIRTSDYYIINSLLFS